MNLFPEGLPPYQLAVAIVVGVLILGAAAAAMVLVVRWWRRTSSEARRETWEQFEALREDFEPSDDDAPGGIPLERWQIDDASNGRR